MTKLDKLYVPSYKGDSVEGSTLETCSRSVKMRRVLPNQVTASRSQKPPMLPPLVFNGNVEYIQTLRAAEAVASEIEIIRPDVLGFDLEWQVSFVKGEAPRPTATLQLCAPLRPPGCPESPAWGTAFVFHLCHMRSYPGTSTTSGGTDVPSEAPDELPGRRRNCHESPNIPDSLVRVLSDPGILLVGVGISGDACRLEREYTELRERGIQGTVDLGELAKAKMPPDRRKKGTWSLADLCREMMKLDLAKPQDLRMSNWERNPLSVQQLDYAATDAYAGLRLWQELKELEGGPAWSLILEQVMEAMPNILCHSAVSGGEGESSGSHAPTEANVEDPRISGCSVTGGETRESSEGVMRAVSDACAAMRQAFAGQGPDEGRETSARRLSATKLETYRLWYNGGLTIEAVAEARCIKTSTALGYIADCVEAGLPHEWRRLNIDPQTESGIVDALLLVRAEASNLPTVAGEDATPSRSLSGGRISRDKGDFPQIIEEQGACAEGTKRAGGTEESLQEECQDASSRQDSTGPGWEYVSLKKVKDLAPPQAEYWQIKLILARLKSGWNEHDAPMT